MNHTRSITTPLVAVFIALALSFGAYAEPVDNLSFIKTGSRYFLVGAQGTSLPYAARILESGGGGWFLVEHVTTRGGTNQPKTVRMWINFTHVASAQELTPDDEQELQKKQLPSK